MAAVALTPLLWALSETEQGKNVRTNDNSQMIVGERERGELGSSGAAFSSAEQRQRVTNASSYSNCSLLLLQWEVVLLAGGAALLSRWIHGYLQKLWYLLPKGRVAFSTALVLQRNAFILRAPVQPWAKYSTFPSPILFTVKVVLIFLWGRQRI